MFTQSNRCTTFFITHLTNLIDLVMNDLSEYSQGVCLNSFDCLFVHKYVKCTNKTEIKDGCNIQTKKSLSGDIIILYTPKDLVMNQKNSTFSKPFFLLKVLYL